MVLDYMGLLQDRYQGKEYERERVLSKRLLQINRRLGIASIVIHSMNKSGEFSGAQGIQHDVDIATVLEPDETLTIKNGDYRAVKMRPTKIRDSETGLNDITLLAHTKIPRFVSAETKYFSMQSMNGARANGGVR